MELFIGGYFIAVVALAAILAKRRGTPFSLTYSWGAAIGLIANVIYQSTTRAGVDLVAALLAVIVVAFAVYITARQGLS